ncbi:MAG: hypothetical protein LBT26_01950 [Clostridiales Family XIII bacterium]|jgi:hypothetical protein|nr:hypothetical protein [Clostridiales Family XIII bacterium]
MYETMRGKTKINRLVFLPAGIIFEALALIISFITVGTGWYVFYLFPDLTVPEKTSGILMGIFIGIENLALLFLLRKLLRLDFSFEIILILAGYAGFSIYKFHHGSLWDFGFPELIMYVYIYGAVLFVAVRMILCIIRVVYLRRAKK